MKYNYSLQEVLGVMAGEDLDYYKGASAYTIQEGSKLYDQLCVIIGAEYLSGLKFLETNEGTTDLTDIAKDLVDNVVVRFYKFYCMNTKYDINVNFEGWLEAFHEFLGNFLNILNLTYDKYSFLLSSYQAKKSKLLDGMDETEDTSGSSTATSNSRFNDTPQDQFAEGQDYGDDSHATNLGHSKTETESSIGVDRVKNNKYLMERLAMIDDLYQNLLLRWSNEFRRLFIVRKEEE